MMIKAFYTRFLKLCRTYEVIRVVSCIQDNRRSLKVFNFSRMKYQKYLCIVHNVFFFFVRVVIMSPRVNKCIVDSFSVLMHIHSTQSGQNQNLARNRVFFRCFTSSSFYQDTSNLFKNLFADSFDSNKTDGCT